MKKLIFAGVLITAVFIPIAVSEGQVMPVCSIIEENPTISKENNNTVINEELENYVVGVVAGEMPVNFPHEAIKAQAVAARTYAVRQINTNPSIKYEDIDQAYVTVEKMKKMWGDNFETHYNKIKNDVYSTAGQIIEYENEPILAAFCSTTNGYTEECVNVWTQDLPYLKSVKSDGDELSPYYNDNVTISKSRFINIFGSTSVSNIEKTPAGYVKSLTIGGKIYEGSEIRKILGLKSNSFDISISGENIVINTKGFGHGVGMSQYGACYMANSGKTYIEILSHYYKGTNIKNL
ncbi:MAG: stage II sporulation protein D [Clostridia bacterium]|nr:stage II sporulation protein D [Clostridia bacterium]